MGKTFKFVYGEVVNDEKEGFFVSWEDYANLKAERDALAAKLAELQKQEHYVEVMKAGPMTVCHWMKPAEELPDGARLFTRPAPAANLAELVPDEMTWNQARSLLDINQCGEDRFSAFMMGANYNRADILRKIEEAK